MFSRLNVLSITGFKQPEKCGKTLCENALTRSALYCEGKSISRLSYRDANVFILQKEKKFPFEVSPEGYENAGGC